MPLTGLPHDRIIIAESVFFDKKTHLIEAIPFATLLEHLRAVALKGAIPGLEFGG
jgi:hypothetical protein